MKLLITGICGFVGSALARAIREAGIDWQLLGIDNFARHGSESNAGSLAELSIDVRRGDLRNQSDIDALPAFDWVIDAAALTNVRAGADHSSSSRQLMEHNLVGTVNLLERCRQLKAGLILLSTSRVYSIRHLQALPLTVENAAYKLDVPAIAHNVSTAVSNQGINEQFPTSSPISLYGATKLASETLALEYGHTFDFPVWINRCGVMAGAGQFGKADQGIFAFWINSHLRRQPLTYIGFDGQGHQVRDCLHPRDLVPLIAQQMQAGTTTESSTTTTSTPISRPQVLNVSGGMQSAMSLRQLTHWCDTELGPHIIDSRATTQRFDVPWLILDASQAQQVWNWQPQTPVQEILSEISTHALAHPDWLNLSL